MTKGSLIPEERFWQKVDRNEKGEDDCWLWIKSCYGGGYGSFRSPASKKTVGAHRYSYEINKGEIPNGKSVIQKCKNRKCVNPRHLILIDDDHGLPLEERFWKHIDKKGEDECWYWTEGCDGYGYGQIRESNDGKIIRTHRYSYELYHGPIPDGEDCCHRCNHPPCCNPKHLYAGTRKKNMEQAINDGRIPLGEDRPNAKLTNEQVREIKKLLANGAKAKNIAIQFSISIYTVYDIRSGRRWKFIP